MRTQSIIWSNMCQTGRAGPLLLFPSDRILKQRGVDGRGMAVGLLLMWPVRREEAPGIKVALQVAK